MDETPSFSISPYLLRPIRKLEDVLAQREQERIRKNRPTLLHPPKSANGRFVVIHGGKS